MAEHLQAGKAGEEEAVRYLRHKGLEIVETNWRYHPYEVDVIAMDGVKLVFVEVKTRSTDEWEHPMEAVTRNKISFLCKAVEAYIELHHLDYEVRFDIVSVIYRDGHFDIEHIEEAFYPEVNR